MQTVRLGRTGAEVSAAGLGCGGASRLGMARGASVEEAATIVRRAIELGVAFIDTAEAYGTEKAVGLGVAARRDEVFISTKSSPRRGNRLATAAEFAASIEASLGRLAIDRIDLFHLHGVGLSQYPYCVETLLPELKRAQASGKIRFIGITEGFGRDTSHRMLADALADDHFDVVMTGCNILNPSARTKVFPASVAHDVGTLIMFAVRRNLSDAAALREAVAGLIARGEVDGTEIDAADPLGFLTAEGGAEIGGGGGLSLLPP